MCLAIKRTARPKRAKKDIIVYKICSAIGHDINNLEVVDSWSHDFSYILGKKYYSKIGRTNDSSTLDDIESRIVYEYLEDFPEKSSKDIAHIGPGFHFAFNKERLKDLYEEDYVLVECTIPKGSLYITGIDNNLGVTESIIINKKTNF